MLKGREFIIIQILVANCCKWVQFNKCKHGYNVRPKRITVKWIFLEVWCSGLCVVTLTICTYDGTGVSTKNLSGNF